MELDIVHIATTVSLAAIDLFDPIFKDLFTLFGDNNRYFACNVDSEFFQRRRLVARNLWFDVAPNKKI